MKGDCERDPESTICRCDPPCGSICIAPGCDKPAKVAVPCELIFGSQDGRLLKTDWNVDEEINDYLTSGGWDVWVCEGHGI